MIKDIHSAIAKGTRVLIVSAEDIVVFDRDESGRGHVWTPTLCLDLAEGVRRMGYLSQEIIETNCAEGTGFFSRLFRKVQHDRT